MGRGLARRAGIALGLFFLIPYFMDRAAARSLVDAVQAEVFLRVRNVAAEAAPLPIASSRVATNALDADGSREAEDGERAKR